MELKINFSIYLKRSGDVARSVTFDRIAINDRDEEAIWHCEERPISRDPYQPLIFTYLMGTRGEIGVYQMRLISTVDRESYNSRDYVAGKRI